MNAITLFVQDDDSEKRIDRLLAESLPDLSRNIIQTLIREGKITVNDQAVKNSYRVSSADRIIIIPPEEEHPVPEPELIDLEILFENDDIAVINKPAGMVIHPATGNTSGTLVNAMMHQWPEISMLTDTSRAGIVHRLDKDTSGVLVIAKNEAALESLKRQFKERSVEKTYVALVHGHPNLEKGIIDAPIGRDPKQRKRMTVISGGKPAKTGYQVLEYFSEYAFLSLDLLTGRTHQIRVHMAWIGHPVAGDHVYGPRKERLSLKRQFLHAGELSFLLPGSLEKRTFSAPLSSDLEAVLLQLREGPAKRHG